MKAACMWQFLIIKVTSYYIMVQANHVLMDSAVPFAIDISVGNVRRSMAIMISP